MTKQKRFGKSFLSCILALALLFSTLPTTVFADEVVANDDVGNLCEHHIEHDSTVCGYLAEVEEQECTHIHDETCYTEATVDSPATDSNVEEKVLSCSHVHDENCGNIEAVMGAPCVFKCEQCSPIDSGEGLPGINYVMITSFDELGEEVRQQSVAAKAPLTDLKLPDNLQVTGYTIANDTVVLDSGATSTTSSSITIKGVTWEVDPTHELNMGTSIYDEQAEQGTYCFTPVLPEGYALAADVALPEIHVVVGGVNRLANGVTLITNRNDLIMMDSGGSYVLGNDIDLQGSNWTPLTLDNFTFDGQGHSIYGFSAQAENAGLFGSVKGDVTIRNLTVRDASLSGYKVGAIIGSVQSNGGANLSNITMTNCYSYNMSFEAQVAMGGLIGSVIGANVYMEQCSAHAGLIGKVAGNLTMKKCLGIQSASYFYSITDWKDYGGLVGLYEGWTYNGSPDDCKLQLSDCYTKGGRSYTLADRISAGGFVGRIDTGEVTMQNCYTTMNDEISTASSIDSEKLGHGAFVGAAKKKPNVISCYYDQWTSARYAIGRVAGEPVSLPNAAKTLEQLGQQSTYAGWDFTDIWSLDQTSLPIFRDGQSGGNPPDPATSITVSPLTLTLKIDETNDLVITTSPNELQYTCVSSDPEIANVTNEGIVTAKKEGSTTITVSLVDTPTEKARCTVTVLPLEPYDDLMCAIAASQLAYENALTGFDFGGTVAQFADAAIDPSRKLWESKANISLANFYKEVLGEWKIVGVTSYSSGLFAVALHNIEQNKTVIAFRGTETPKDLTTDILMGISNTLTTQFTDSIQFYNKYKGSGEVLLTGHSLGGSLAAHVSMNTSVHAEVFNAAIGWSLAGTYAQKTEAVFQNFTGIERWNFTNHATASSNLLDGAHPNELVAFKYDDKLPMRIYDVSATGMGGRLNIHELNSMLEYDEQNKKFAFSSSSPWGNTSGSLQEFPPLAFGDLYTFGTSGADTVLRYSSTGLITSTRIFGGDGNDQLTTNVGGSDWLVSGTGSNALDGGAWNDSYFLIPCDGTQIINDPSGFDTIYLPSGVRVTNQMQSGEYIIAHLSNGQTVQVNAKRNFLAPAINIRSMDGADCGKLELKSRASRTAMQIPISTIEIDGNVVINIVDESGNSVGMVDTAKDTFPRYENYGYFYLDEQTQHLSAILFNGAYRLEITNTGSPINYTMMRHAEDDRPLARATAGGITLETGSTLNTQTTFTSESTVPLTIKKSDGTEGPVPYTVEDLTEAGDTSAVTGVLVTPKSVNVNKGATQKFIASVTGTGNYNNVVRWSVSGGAAGTQIDSNGKLTVAANETATLLTVTATSVQDSGKTDTAAITVTDKPNVSLHQLTISGSHAQNTGEGAYAEGTKVSVDAGTRDGYNFNGWTSVGGGTFTDKKSRNTIFTMPSNDVTIVANWVSAGGDSDGGNTSGGGGNLNKPTITSTPDSAVLPAIGEIKVDGTVDKDGNATVTVSDKAITDAINAAKKVAGENGISISIYVNLQQTANRLTVSISKVSLDKLIAEGVKDLKISSSLVNMSFNLEALKEIQKSAVGNMNISAKKQNIKTLSAAAQTIIGNRPVFDFSMQSGDITITSFGKGTVSIWMPYALAANEIAGNVQAVYVDGRGTVSPIIVSSYDVITKMMLFSTSHFSIYGVGYKQDAPKFIDISNHWAKDSIEFVAARGMLTGTGGNAFSPDSPITRGMFVTALGRLANADVSGNKISSFTDVNAGTYYLSYIEWAVKNNIVQGMGNGTFAPDQAISREQMAVMTQNYAKAIGFNLPKVHAENTFADSAKIGGYAKNAVKAMQMAGILAGKNGNNFDPQGTATRAEVSALLQRFVELAISTGSAQGWMMNDSGKWMFYENGRPITGKKNIGGVSYVFDQNGEISDMPKNLTYGSYTVKSGDSFWKIAEVYKCNVYELARTNGKTIFSIIHPGEVLKILPQ